MAEWKKAPSGTVLLRYCVLHGWIETTQDECPHILQFDESCGMELDPAEPFVPLGAYDAATTGGWES